MGEGFSKERRDMESMASRRNDALERSGLQILHLKEQVDRLIHVNKQQDNMFDAKLKSLTEQHQEENMTLRNDLRSVEVEKKDTSEKLEIVTCNFHSLKKNVQQLMQDKEDLIHQVQLKEKASGELFVQLQAKRKQFEENVSKLTKENLIKDQTIDQCQKEVHHCANQLNERTRRIQQLEFTLQQKHSQMISLQSELQFIREDRKKEVSYHFIVLPPTPTPQPLLIVV